MQPFKISTKCLCVLSILASLGSMFSTSVFAQANGAKISSEITLAIHIIDFATEKNICSTAHIADSTLRADCTSDVTTLQNLVTQWAVQHVDGTLTVAYDAAVESELYATESALQTVLNDAGFTYSATASSVSPDFQISPDEMSPDSSGAVCALCGGSAAAGYYVCLTTIELPPVALVCGIGVALGYLACAWDACIQPPEPPKSCPA
jgi:hypothetical protein